jgi:hypothetical protein
VVVRVRPAEAVQAVDHELGRLQRGGSVEVDHLVERAVDRALGRRPVVADDVEDERVVKHAQVVQGIDQPAHVVVGVLEEAGVDLHLPPQHRKQLRGHVIPGRDLVMALGQLGLGRDDA